MEALLAHGPFAEFALLLIVSAVVGAIAVSLRQPLLISYIVVGILLGPALFGPVNAAEQIHLLAEIGVAVLLFVVGLKLDLAHIRNIGPAALATGLGQLTFTIVFGFALTLLMGKSTMEAIYIAVALTFSSTIIIVKLLSDKHELDSLHGRIAVGFLIVQDLAVVLAMMTMSALRGAGDAGWAEVSGSLLLRLAGAAILMYVLMRYVLPPLVSRMARSQELLLIFAIAWGTGLAALGDYIGFSKEAGAFVAGFSLASTAYREAMNARLTGIRDFMLLFFFIDLGGRLDFSTLGNEILPAIVLALFVLIGNPLIVMAIMGYMGYRKRTGFLAGLTVAQISEFSIVFVAMGITLGHIGPEALGLTTLVGLVTIMLSTYMILFSQPLYERLAPWLGLFERKRPYRELEVEAAGPSAHHHLRPGPLWLAPAAAAGRRTTTGARRGLRPGSRAHAAPQQAAGTFRRWRGPELSRIAAAAACRMGGHQLSAVGGQSRLSACAQTCRVSGKDRRRGARRPAWQGAGCGRRRPCTEPLHRCGGLRRAQPDRRAGVDT